MLAKVMVMYSLLCILNSEYQQKKHIIKSQVLFSIGGLLLKVTHNSLLLITVTALYTLLPISETVNVGLDIIKGKLNAHLL